MVEQQTFNLEVVGSIPTGVIFIMEEKIYQYQRTKDKKLKDELFSKMYNLLGYYSRKWAKYDMLFEAGDYLGIAYFGFEKAINTYDGRMEPKEYIIKMCENAVVDYIRNSGPIKRITYEKIQKAKKKKKLAEQRELREVTWAEILEGNDWDELVEVTEAPVFDTDIPFYSTIDWKIELEWFYKQLKSLDEKLQEIILLKIKGESFKTIGERYGVGPTRAFLWYHEGVSKLEKMF